MMLPPPVAGAPSQVVTTPPARSMIGISGMMSNVFNPASTGGGGGLSASQSVVIAPLFASASAASYRSNEIARDSIVAGFGVNLATGVEVARTNPLPTNLLGTRVSIRVSMPSMPES